MGVDTGAGVKKKHTWLFYVGIGALILLLLAAILLLFALPHITLLRQLKLLENGFSYTGNYTVAGLEENSATSEMLDAAGLWEGGITGEGDRKIIYVSVTPKGEKEPLTDGYFGDGSGELNMQMLYERFQKNISAEHELIGSLLPEWNAGTYITFSQVEELTDIKLPQYNLEPVWEYGWMAVTPCTDADLKEISFVTAQDGMRYYQLRDEVTDSYEVVIGVEKKMIYQLPLELHVWIYNRDTGGEGTLNLTLEAKDQMTRSMPKDTLSSQDMKTLGKIWDIYQIITKAAADGKIESLEFLKEIYQVLAE